MSPSPNHKAFVIVLAVWALSVLGVRSASAENPFAPPPAFAPDIHFWKRIYTEVGTDGGLLHDDRHLGVVYEMMKFPADLTPAERARRIAAAKDRYRSILNKLAQGAEPNDAELRRVRALWPDASARTLREASGRIRFQLGQSNRFREGLIRAGAYEAHIAETLANMGLPAELAALPHVESSFDPTAYSHAGAAGLWQFIRSTGRRYMRVDADVDERLDPYRSTVAAAQFLKFNYDLLGTWPLALTAYNHGPAGMRRAKERMGTDDIVKISRHYQSPTFGFASRNYYIAFLAALEVDRETERYFGSLRRDPEIKTRSVFLQDYVPVAALERTFGLDARALRLLNPSLTAAVWRGERYVPRGFELRLPEALTAEPEVLLASLGSGERFDRQRPELTYRVRRGETLSAIAARNGTSVAALMSANGMSDARRLRAGQMLKIPQGPLVRVALAQTTPAESQVKKVESKAVQMPPEESAAATHKVAMQTKVEPPPLAQPPVTAAVVAEADQEVARSENAEPVSQSEAEEMGPQLVASEGSPLLADPSDYSVREDMTLVVQAAETLGHLAEWLDLRASRLRELNKLRFNQPLVIGRRLSIELTRVSVEEFERRRRAYHQQLQEAFFAANRIAGTQIHVVRRGESLWSIAQSNPRVPIWLLRQHNPDVDFAEVRPKTPIVLPLIEAVASPAI